MASPAMVENAKAPAASRVPLDGVGTQDGLIVVATANDPSMLDATILKRPRRFDRVIPFRPPDSDLRADYLHGVTRGD
jgi:SpoVK/Ycf46/Vps4 family AAA+-type ATPase